VAPAQHMATLPRPGSMPQLWPGGIGHAPMHQCLCTASSMRAEAQGEAPWVSDDPEQSLPPPQVRGQAV
jgi:hypothetical protein